MPEDLVSRVALVSLNTRGIAPAGSRLAGRYAAIGRALETGDADVASFQEVLTWWHLWLLTRRMRSFRHVSFRPSPAGPAGGLVTFSRRPVSGTAYRGFGVPPPAVPDVLFRAVHCVSFTSQRAAAAAINISRAVAPACRR